MKQNVTMNKFNTAEEAKAKLAYQGISIAQFARLNDFPEAMTRQILQGKRKCTKGISHNIAIALGMKAGIPTQYKARNNKKEAA